MAEFKIDPQLRSMLIDTHAQVHVLQTVALTAILKLINSAPVGDRGPFLRDLERNMLDYNLPPGLLDPVERQYYLDLSVAIDRASKDIATFLRSEVQANLAAGAVPTEKPN